LFSNPVDYPFVSLIERPLLDTLRLEILARTIIFKCSLAVGWSHAASSQEPADTILDQIAVFLRREMLSWRDKPTQNLTSTAAG